MTAIIIRDLSTADKVEFIKAMNSSLTFHTPWVQAPQTSEEFDQFYKGTQQDNKKCFLACNNAGNIVGVFNLNEIVRGFFQSAYLGYYGVSDHSGKGNMSAALKLVLAAAFNEMQLHRIEANIQPENTVSIALVKANGFLKEGYSPRYLKINDEWRDHERLAITLEDYESGIFK